MGSLLCSSGTPYPLGATLCADGVNFAVFSANADKIQLCLFIEGREIALPIHDRTGDIWHIHVHGIGTGTEYGFRADGRYAPAEGHWFNPRKLLLDPYTRELSGSFGDPGLLHSGSATRPSPRDSAAAMPHSVVTDSGNFDWADARPPGTSWEETVIYEAHVRGLTQQHPGVPDGLRGTFAGIAHPAIVEHLQKLGVTALELLPVQAFMDEAHLHAKGLSNYWGYNTHSFFAPHPSYGSKDDFREMVRTLHRVGIEVILDVVYNHTAEGDARGPTLSFRGLDNAAYYMLGPDGAYENHTGCGNTLAVAHPAVMRLVLDSLRYWVTELRVDGFRFDLAPVLARSSDAIDMNGGFLAALTQDPVLSRVKLIAEPWDIGPGGYRAGGFPSPLAEWNDHFRDDVRRFWRGDAHGAHGLATRLSGSADRFDRGGRRVWSSINFVTAHDGFTLADLVSYERKHNAANREGNRDGHAHNLSSNFGIEGPTDNPEICSARNRRRRNLFATMMLAQGTPMMLSGDELGNSQGGNNNAYCQDNPTGWVDWSAQEADFLTFVRRVIATRHDHSVLRQPLFLHGGDLDGRPDIEWFGLDGRAPDWEDNNLCALSVVIRPCAERPPWTPEPTAICIVVNRGEGRALSLPPGQWRPILDTATPNGSAPSSKERMETETLAVFAEERAADTI